MIHLRDAMPEPPDAEARPERGAVDWLKPDDWPALLAMERAMYAPQYVLDRTITDAWWRKNPYMCLVLFNASDRRDLWAVLTIMPLQLDLIYRILRGESSEAEITPEHILTYEPGHTYTGYVQSIMIRPQFRRQFRLLVECLMATGCHVYPNIQMRALYGFAASDEGLRLIKHLGFRLMTELGDNAFELDLGRPNHARVIRSLQHRLAQKAAMPPVDRPDLDPHGRWAHVYGALRQDGYLAGRI